MSQLLDFLRTYDEAFRSRARLASLYSDFRLQRNLNPDGYQANASAWLRALTTAAKAGLIPAQTGGIQHDRFSIHTGEELLRALTTQEYGRPLSLGAVIDDAVRKKDLISLQEFLDSKQNIYAKSWIPTPWQVMNWGLRQLGVIGRDGAEDRLITGNFVIMANVEAAAKAVLGQVSRTATSNTARIFSQDLFVSSMAPALGLDDLSSRDASVLLIHLARDHAAIAYEAQTGTIKFKNPSETAPATIEQEDITIASLRTLITSLEPQISQLMKQISALELKAREAVANKQLTSAKTALRQKKLADTKLQQRTATLAQLEEVYAKIEQATDQVEIVKVMEASSQALRSLNQRTGGVEKVQDVVDGLREEMMNVDEIQTALSEPAAGTIDEGEVEDELEALEMVEREKVEAAERAEREKREAAEKAERAKREAEATRKRLEELESVPGCAVAAQKKETVPSSQENVRATEI